MVVVRSRQAHDNGAVVHLNEFRDALRFALDWQDRHPSDRLCVFSEGLIPIAALDYGEDGELQSGSSASGTLS
jgi:hypothetical protein